MQENIIQLQQKIIQLEDDQKYSTKEWEHRLTDKDNTIARLSVFLKDK